MVSFYYHVHGLFVELGIREGRCCKYSHKASGNPTCFALNYVYNIESIRIPPEASTINQMYKQQRCSVVCLTTMFLKKGTLVHHVQQSSAFQKCQLLQRMPITSKNTHHFKKYPLLQKMTITALYSSLTSPSLKFLENAHYFKKYSLLQKYPLLQKMTITGLYSSLTSPSLKFYLFLNGL